MKIVMWAISNVHAGCICPIGHRFPTLALRPAEATIVLGTCLAITCQLLELRELFNPSKLESFRFVIKLGKVLEKSWEVLDLCFLWVTS